MTRAEVDWLNAYHAEVRAKIGPRASDGAPVRIRIDRELVVPTGGGYFFAPSITALAGVLSG